MLQLENCAVNPQCLIAYTRHNNEKQQNQQWNYLNKRLASYSIFGDQLRRTGHIIRQRLIIIKQHTLYIIYKNYSSRCVFFCMIHVEYSYNFENRLSQRLITSVQKRDQLLMLMQQASQALHKLSLDVFINVTQGCFHQAELSRKSPGTRHLALINVRSNI